MEFSKAKLAGVWLLKPKVFRDERGFFMESFSQRWFVEQGIDATFVQDNHSRSVERGVLRGLHFQQPPHAQAKLVRVIRGSIYDVVVDLRKASTTYGQWEGFTLDDQDYRMLFVPRGFAHGFCTLEPDTEVLYKTDNYYAPEADSGIIWNDPALGIAWPVPRPILSEKDGNLASFSKLSNPF